jgi:hypothetical protein
MPHTAAQSTAGSRVRKGGVRHNRTVTFRDAELSPPTNLQIVRPRRFAPVNVSQSLIIRRKEQTLGNCSSDLRLSAFDIAFWVRSNYRWIGICF